MHLIRRQFLRLGGLECKENSVEMFRTTIFMPMVLAAEMVTPLCEHMFDLAVTPARCNAS